MVSDGADRTAGAPGKPRDMLLPWGGGDNSRRHHDRWSSSDSCGRCRTVTPRTSAYYLGGVGEVSIQMLNQETSRVLARVKQGEEIVLTDRGVIVARIIPAEPGPLDRLTR